MLDQRLIIMYSLCLLKKRKVNSMSDSTNELDSWAWPDGLGASRAGTGSKPKRAVKVNIQEAYFPLVSCEEAFSWHRVGPNALVLMMLLNRWQVMGVRPPYIIGDQVMDLLEMGSWTRDRTLAALEKAGFVRTERHRGRLPRIWLLDTPEEEGKPDV
jgi:hypothetical protein